MKRTCLISVLVILICILAVFVCAHWLITLEYERLGQLASVPHRAILASALGIAIPCGILDAWGLGYLYSSFQSIHERTMLKRQAHHHRWVDGEKVAVAGTVIQPGPLLKGPISGTECVAYAYDIYHITHRSSGGTSRISDFSGFAFTPFAVQTDAGSIALIGYVDFDFPEESFEEESAYQTAKSYIESTDFQQTHGLSSLKDLLAEMKDVLSDEDGVIRKDWARVGPEYNIGNDDLVEQHIKVGEPVCAFGTFSSTRLALLTDSGDGDPVPVRVIKGDLNAIRRKLTRRALGYFFGAGIVLTASVVVFKLMFHVMIPS